MDILGGIIDAIEAEWKQPAPSHANLARLLAMALREIMSLHRNSQAIAETTSSNGGTATVQSAEPLQDVKDSNAL